MSPFALAVAEILKSRDVQRWVTVRVLDQERSHYRQATPGRPGKDTHYVLEVQTRFSLSCEVDAARLQQEEQADGIFPLITNQRQMSAEEVLRAYKRQPFIEKRFSQFKSDFEVAPVYLKEVSRIQGLLGVYFLALLLQTLLERELRQAMQRDGVKSLPLYGEQRACQRPTARKILDLFEPLQRHVLTLPDGRQEILRTQLSAPQRQILKLLKIPLAIYTG
jgi:transposase